MSFITQSRLIGKPMYISQWQFFFFDALFVVFLFVLSNTMQLLVRFENGQPLIVAFPYAISMLAGLGVYGVRLAMYVAMVRENQTPQKLEWIVFLVGIGFSSICLLFGQTMLNHWAVFNHYQRCTVEQTHNPDAVFAHVGTPCPPHWKGQPFEE